MGRALRLSGGALGFLAMAVFCSSGCGPGIKDRGIVRGKVTIGGKPLNSGTVQFVTADNRAASTTIKEDGTYELPDAPVGECKITVTVGSSTRGSMGGGTGMIMPGGKAAVGAPPGKLGGTGAPKLDNTKPPPGATIGGGDGMQMTGPPPQIDPKKQVKIPDRYSNLETSGLTFTVVKGEQTYDIPLTP